ncbi:hypothetical protein [Rhizobium yanglingense]
MASARAAASIGMSADSSAGYRLDRRLPLVRAGFVHDTLAARVAPRTLVAALVGLSWQGTA